MTKELTRKDCELHALLKSLTSAPIANLRWSSSLHKRKEEYPGEWCSEPDDITWYLPASHVICCMHRHASYGFWCGYLGLPYTPAGNDTNKVNEHFHGGITYKSSSLGCYHKEEGEPFIEWWVGFDCGHCYDLQPFEPYRTSYSAEYRNVDYVAKTLIVSAEAL